MRCSKAIQLMEFKLNRELAPNRVQALEQHLAVCPACQAYKRLSGRLANFLGQGRRPEFPSWIHLQIMDKAAAHDNRRRTYQRRWKLRAVPALVAAVLCLYVGSIVGKAAYTTVNPFPDSSPALASQTESPALFGEGDLIESILPDGGSHE